MEVQTFLLAEKIEQHGSRHDVTNAALAMMECSPETPFPLRFSLPGLAVLRRESDSGDAPFSLRLDLVDEDGRPAGLPRGLLARGVFTAGNRLYYLVVKVDLEFPRPGVYRLDVTADEGLAGNVCHYAIEIRQRGQG